MARLYITKDNIVLPFNLLLNVDKSVIPFSTEIEETTISIPGVSGEIQVDNRYAAKTHNLVLWSWPDITHDEKESMYKKINNFLVGAKNVDQDLYYQRLGRTYYVRAIGKQERPMERANFIEFALNLKSHDPYGYKDGEFGARNVGEFIDNLGNVETPVRIEFTGPCVNPSVTINGTVYGYTGTVPNGYKLRADAKGYTVDFVNISNGVSSYENTIGWNGNFLIAPFGKLAIQDIQNAAGKVAVYWRNRWA